MELKNKVITSTAWLAAFQVIDQGIGFLRLLILTHFLSPREFGYAGFAWLVIQIITTFTQPGIQAALIQKEKHAEEYLNPVWSFLLLRGVTLSAVTFLLAPWIAIFFNDIQVTPIIRALSFVFLLEPLANIGMIKIQRELDFKKHFIFLLFGSIADFITALIIAVLTHSVWAIVLGILVNNIVKLILSYVLSPYRPKFTFDFSKVRELSNFSKWIFFSNILMFLYSQGDDIIVGKILGAGSLGIYQTAYKISNLPSTQITFVFSTVLFPAFSRLQNNISRVRDVYQDSLQMTSFLSVMVGCAIIYFASDFTALFLGDQWTSMVPVLQVLTLWGIIRSVGSTSGPLWQALGKPKLTTMTQVLQVLVLAITIYPLTMRYGILGTSLSVVAAALVPNIVNLLLIVQIVKCSLFKILSHVTFPIAYGLLSTALLSAIRPFLGNMNILVFVVLCMIYLMFYGVFTLLLDRLFKQQLIDNILALTSNVPLMKTAYMKKTTALLMSKERRSQYEN